MIEITEEVQSASTKKQQQFEEQLTIIEVKYMRWFGGRKHQFTGETDTIHNYYRYFNASNGNLQLHMKEGLPFEIGKDCKLAFSAIFGN